MTVQASAVRRLLEADQDKEREALLVVEQTGREALAEMRRMVGVLRRPDEAPALAPQPSLDRIEQLVAHTRETGLPVELRIEGTPVELPAGIDTTAYRIVQEALTNAVKHARASRAEVVVQYENGTRRANGQRRRPRRRRRRWQRARARRDARTGVRVRRRAGGRTTGRRRLPSPCHTPHHVNPDESATTTLTFLFSDVEGSTALLRRLRDGDTAP